MTLGELKAHFESLPEGAVLPYSLSNPFSWRGSYNEVAFTILNTEATRETLLHKVKKALSDLFIGYKGGDYRYNEYTDIHFEDSISAWTDGGYAAEWIARLTDTDAEKTIEHRLVNLAFKPL